MTSGKRAKQQRRAGTRKANASTSSDFVLSPCLSCGEATVFRRTGDTLKVCMSCGTRSVTGFLGQVIASQS